MRGVSFLSTTNTRVQAWPGVASWSGVAFVMLVDLLMVQSFSIFLAVKLFYNNGPYGPQETSPVKPPRPVVEGFTVKCTARKFRLRAD